MKESNSHLKDARYYFKNGRYDEAITCYELATEKAINKLGKTNKINLANILCLTGESYFKLEQFDEAIDCYIESLDHCFQSGIYQATSAIDMLKQEVLSNMALVFLAQSDYKNCLECMLTSHKIRGSGKFFQGVMEICYRETDYAEQYPNFNHWLGEKRKAKNHLFLSPAQSSAPACPPAQTPRESGSRYSAGSCSETARGG